MLKKSKPAATRAEEPYFQRFGFCPPQISAPPPSDLGMVVVVPCHNEPDLTGALESLCACDPPECAVEVIVVINGAADATPVVREQNATTLKAAREWVAGRSSRLHFYFLDFPELPPKSAGVGLARKIGMDEALRRFLALGRADAGVIVCYDADCRCALNYLRAIERHFASHPDTPGCSIYYEHPLEGALPGEIYEAITAYELHLRFYVQALRFIECPHAFHTVGSSMAVRAGIYRDQGGMNKRQAGEDFYFLHKVIPLGGFTELNETVVYPSPRASDRVPFGTGRAMRCALEGSQNRTYPLEAFLDLGVFFSQVEELDASGPGAFTAVSAARFTKPLSPLLQSFLAAQGFEDALKEIRANTASPAAFCKRFFRWFDGFRVLKCIHYLRDGGYGDRDIVPEARELLGLMAEDTPLPELTARGLLAVYRALDRGSDLRAGLAGVIGKERLNA